MVVPDWNARYLNGELPWETGRVDSNLPAMIEEHGLEPCSALELGCGTGNNAIWLASQGFTVTAVDVSKAAILAAREKAEQAGVTVELACADIADDDFARGPFGFAFDRGCFHSIGDDLSLRQKFAKMVCERLSVGGYWLSLIGSADGPDREKGPPRLSATEIVGVVEPCFEIVAIQGTHFDSDQENRPRAWRCLMRRRSL